MSRPCARTMSAMVTMGKSSPNGAPVSGLIDAGPVVPMQPPSTFDEMTKKRSVSNGRPGPTMVCHQPGSAGHRMEVRDMLVAGQGMADEKRVRALGVERAIGLIGDGQGRQRRARIHDERRRRIDAEREAVRRGCLGPSAPFANIAASPTAAPLLGFPPFSLSNAAFVIQEIGAGARLGRAAGRVSV